MKYIIGNWKMNKTPDKAISFLNEYTKMVKGISIAEKTLIVCVPYIDMFYAINYVQGTNVLIGAQNIYHVPSGAYTGEISAEMIGALGIKYSIVGHSERRKYFNETNEIVSKKVLAAYENNIIPILCVGEDEEIYQNNGTKEYIKKQLNESLKDIAGKNISKIMIAYEPIWAIGTGNTCDAQLANEMCTYIKEEVKKIIGSAEIHVLYGGSVKSTNSNELLEYENISGVLVGGASLDAKEFARISGINI